MVHSPIKPISNCTIQLCYAKFDLASASKSGRYEVENSIHKLGENWTHIFLGEVRPDQSDSAVYVVTYSTRADQALVIVSGCHATYRKAVPFMSIRHRDCVLANPI